MKVWVQYLPWMDAHEVFLARMTPQGRQIGRIAWEDVAENQASGASFTVSAHDNMEGDCLQSLANQLWELGFRPNVAVKGETQALREHLDHTSRLLDQVLPVALRKS